MGAFLKYSSEHSDEIAEFTQISSTASVFRNDHQFSGLFISNT